MLRKPKLKSTTKIPKDSRGKSTTSDNLYVSPSFLKKFRKITLKSQKPDFPKTSSNPTENYSPPEDILKDSAKLSHTVPKDAAAHFGHFYGVQDARKLQPGKVQTTSTNLPTRTLKRTPRFEFTRQMVHKLERTVGTEEYARQVSALLEETVEPAHFKPRSLPTENSIPDGRQSLSGFPLWYKEPFKTPFNSEMYKLLRDEHERESKIGINVFEEESSQEDFWKESDVEEEIEESEIIQFPQTTHTEELNSVISASTSATETQDTDSKGSVENISNGRRKISFRV